MSARTPLLSARANSLTARSAAASQAAALAAAQARRELASLDTSLAAPAGGVVPSPIRTGRPASTPGRAENLKLKLSGLDSGPSGAALPILSGSAEAAVRHLAKQLLPELLRGKALLRRIDADGLGVINMHSFQRLLLDFGVELGGTALQQVQHGFAATVDEGILYNKFLARVGQCIQAGPATVRVPSKLRTQTIPVQGFGLTVADHPARKGSSPPCDAAVAVASNLSTRVQALAQVLTAALGRQVVRAHMPQNRHLKPSAGKLATEPFVQALRGFGVKLSRKHLAAILRMAADPSAAGASSREQADDIVMARFFAPLLAMLQPSYVAERRLHLTGRAGGPDAVVKAERRKAAADKVVFYDAETTLRLLGMKMHSKYKSVMQTFHLFDKDRDGSLTTKELRDRLRDLGFHLKDDEFNKLMTVFDADNSGEVSYQEWNNLVGPIVQPGESGAVFFKKKSAKVRPIKEWAEAAFARALTIDAKGVEEAFKRIDVDSDGTISQAEFRNMATKYGLRMNGEQMAKLSDFYDPLENGHIGKANFIARWKYLMTRPYTSGAAKLEEEMKEHVAPVPYLDAELAIKVLRKKLASKFRSVHQAFSTFNPGRGQKLSTAALRKAFQDCLGVFMHDEEHEKLMRDVFDPEGKGFLSYHDFNKVVGELINPTTHWSKVAAEQSKTELRLAPWVEEQFIRGLLKGTGQDMRKVFAKLDPGHTGFVSLTAAQQAARSTGLDIGWEESQALMARYPTNHEGKVTFENFVEVFAELAGQIIEEVTVPEQHFDGGGSTVQPHAFTRSVAHMQPKEGRAMARALAKRTMEAQSGGVPINRKFPVLGTNTLHRMPQAPTLDAFPDRGLARSRTKVKVGGGGKHAATSPSKSVAHSSSMPAMHTLELGGINNTSGSARRPVTPNLSVLSAGDSDDDEYFASRNLRPSTAASSASMANTVARISSLLRANGTWKRVFKHLRRADPAGEEMVPRSILLATLQACGVVATSAEEAATMASADAALALAARFPGARKGYVNYVRMMRRMVPSNKVALFSPARVGQAGLSPGLSHRTGGSVSTRGFMGGSVGHAAPDIGEATAAVRHQVRREWREMRRAFAKADKKRAKALPVQAFRKVLRGFGMNLEVSEFEALERPFARGSSKLPPASARSGGSWGGKGYVVKYNDFLRSQLSHS